MWEKFWDFQLNFCWFWIKIHSPIAHYFPITFQCQIKIINAGKQNERFESVIRFFIQN